MSLLEVQNLCVHFPVKHGVLGRVRESVKAVDGVSLEVAHGETVGVVGESGCGKTTTGRAIVRLIAPTAGQILFEGQDVSVLKGEALRARRQHFQMIFQDPSGALNPRMTVRQIIAEAIDAHGLADTELARETRIDSLLQVVGLDSAHGQRYPSEFSGGQRQRIGIARALAVEPKLIVCDEPVSALDVSVQAQIVNLLQDLQRDRGLAYLFISHDFALVERVSRRVLVMYLGKIVEAGPVQSVVRTPRHPYTQALISAVPELDSVTRRKRIVLPGDAPSPILPPAGCPFHTRCPVAEARCKTDVPALREIQPGHSVSCHLVRSEALHRP